jgi:hypothetical protein
MNTTCPKAQQFYAECCAPYLDKYRKDDDYVVTTPDGKKLFDVQLAMLSEADVFSPLVSCDKKVIGFVVEEYPEYLFADTNHAGTEDSNAPDIFMYVMERLVESDQKTSIFTYSGFRDVYLADESGELSLTA